MEDGTASAAGMNPSSCLRRTEKENLKPSQISLSPSVSVQRSFSVSVPAPRSLGLMAKVVIKAGTIIGVVYQNSQFKD